MTRLLLFVLVLSSCSQLPLRTGLPSRLSILQGATSENSTQFSVVVNKAASVRYFVLTPNQLERRQVQAERITREFSNWAVDKISVEQLSPGVVYRLEAVAADDKVLDQREFLTLKLTQNTLKFAVASCMLDDLREVQKQIWPEFLSHHPDLIFLLGDNVYGDIRTQTPNLATPQELWNRYVETRQTLQLYQSAFLIPILATIDDHDYGTQDGNKGYRYKNESLEIFRTFFAQKPIATIYTAGPGVASQLTAFGQKFVLLDNRSFRTPNLELHGQTHWGIEQERWLLKELDKDHKVTWLFNGDQFYGGYAPFDSFEGNHPENFKKVMYEIKKARSPVVLVSGDRHLFELMKIAPPEFPYTTYEITTSAIHAQVFPPAWDRYPNKRQIAGRAQKYNYAIVTAEAQRAQVNFRLEVFSLGFEKLFDSKFTVGR